MLLFLSVLCTWAEAHDHKQHVDNKFIHGEALRTAWLTRVEMIDYVEDYISALAHISYTYDTIYERPTSH
jgi:hypothetical protein